MNNNINIIRLTRDLNRCLYLLEESKRSSITRPGVALTIKLGSADGISILPSSYDFDTEVEQHLYPYAIEFLKMRAKSLSKELADALAQAGKS